MKDKENIEYSERLGLFPIVILVIVFGVLLALTSHFVESHGSDSNQKHSNSPFSNLLP